MPVKKRLFLSLIVLWGEGFLSPSLFAAEKAASLYKDLCASCHGTTGKGDGSAAAALNPKPKDLTNCKAMAADSNETLLKIIKGGGQSVERSPMMPAFGGALNDQQINDLVAYVRSFCKK